MASGPTPTPLGSFLPDVTLVDADGGEHRLTDLAGGAPTLVVFLANHCPYVRHIEEAFGQFAKEYADRGLHIVGVSSNDVDDYPDDGPEGMREQASRAGWDFPYLADPGQTLAKAAGAACTPDFFLYGPAGTLVYRGAFDGSTPKNDVELTGEDLRAAVGAVLDGTPVPADQRPPIGCSIKWTPGNEPD